MDENSTESTNTHHIAIKPPQFSSTHVNGWFEILEAQFELAKVTQESTKFYHALAALSADTVSRISNEILRKKEYETLKTTVKDIFEQSKSEIFQKLISTVSMGIGKPSQFLRDLQCQAQKVGIGDDLIRHQFLQAIPHSVAPVLAAQTGLSLDELGKLADDLVPLARGGTINAASSSFRNSSPERRRENRDSSGDRGRSVERGKDLHVGLKPFYHDQRPMVCRAHIYFGTKAKTCKPWCRFPKGDNKIIIEPSSRSSSPHPGNESRNSV